MKPYTILACIHSLNGAKEEVKILDKRVSEYGTEYAIVEYNGKICTAIYNIFACIYYVDDIYGIIKE